MAPGASLASTALNPVATLHTGGVLDASVAHTMPGSQPTVTSVVASSTAGAAPAAKPSMSVIEKGGMMQGIFNGEFECDNGRCAGRSQLALCLSGGGACD